MTDNPMTPEERAEQLYDALIGNDEDQGRYPESMQIILAALREAVADAENETAQYKRRAEVAERGYDAAVAEERRALREIIRRVRYVDEVVQILAALDARENGGEAMTDKPTLEERLRSDIRDWLASPRRVEELAIYVCDFVEKAVAEERKALLEWSVKGLPGDMRVRLLAALDAREKGD